MRLPARCIPDLRAVLYLLMVEVEVEAAVEVEVGARLDKNIHLPLYSTYASCETDESCESDANYGTDAQPN